MRPEKEPAGQKGRSFIEEARRAQIVASAIEVIAEMGFAQASLARIARHAGISKGVISYHFSGKDELMEEVVERTYGGIAERVVVKMDGLTTATELLRAHILGVAEQMAGHRTHIKALSEILVNLRTTDGKLRYGMHTNEELYQGIEGIYRLGQESGEFREFDLRVMSVTHQAAVDNMFAYWIANPGHDLNAHAAELADLMERACRA